MRENKRIYFFSTMANRFSSLHPPLSRALSVAEVKNLHLALRSFKNLDKVDPSLFDAIMHEKERQESHIGLVAPENYVSPEIMALQGSFLTNKSAEGYPGKRHHGGCEYIDVIEQLAIERAKLLFNASYVNVQPHMGSQANAAAIMALINPGETILGMSLDHGGHLTHGSEINFSGKLYKATTYGVDRISGLVDYNEVRKQAKLHHPKLIIAGFSAYSRILDWQRFREIADEIGAYLMVDMAHIAGLVAAGLYPNPVSIADVVTTTTYKTLRGPRGGMILARDNPGIVKKINSAVFPGLQGGPIANVIAAKALCFFEALRPEFKTYQEQVLKNARMLASCLTEEGLDIVSGGTDNHMMLVSLVKQNTTGKLIEESLATAHITVNKNMIPYDLKRPSSTSGIRIGTAAVTTRGFKEAEMRQIAKWVGRVVQNSGNEKALTNVKQEVLELCQRFPIYNTTGESMQEESIHSFRKKQ